MKNAKKFTLSIQNKKREHLGIKPGYIYAKIKNKIRYKKIFHGNKMVLNKKN